MGGSTGREVVKGGAVLGGGGVECTTRHNMCVLSHMSQHASYLQFAFIRSTRQFKLLLKQYKYLLNSLLEITPAAQYFDYN